MGRKLLVLIIFINLILLGRLASGCQLGLLTCLFKLLAVGLDLFLQGVQFGRDFAQRVAP